MQQIIRDHLDGAEDRPRSERWVLRWMHFPPTAYTDRGVVVTVYAHRRATKIEEVAEQDLPFEEEAEDRLAA
ncbi:MAG: hypothetical protein J7498_10665 [Sphingobium sp.]|nr:hypothetical protein [Sphingobium sp.]